MIVTIVDYGLGNLHSASKAFARAAREAGIGAEILVTPNPEDVRRADRIVLPGVGAFADCKAGLTALPGMWETLQEQVHDVAKPFMGICVGMQLLADRGLEFGKTEGFGWIKGEVKAIEPNDMSCKIPHMGWNTLRQMRPHEVLDSIRTGYDGLHAYFVHSYNFVCKNEADIVAVSEYGGPVTAMIARDNMIASQFHPEKSQKLGLTFIANFLRWMP
ncbi:MAG: imidazole glycerol phosphate synthase subunit HisH [Hyphomicrobiales bacterium]